MTANTSKELETNICFVEKLFDGSQVLSIPSYQRPYKWTEKNIHQLFSDISTHKDKSEYRLGTIVFHQNEGRKDIVDGQQRIITLLLIIKALAENEKFKDCEKLKKRAEVAKNFKFKSDISKKHIINNYLEIKRLISRPDFTQDHVNFLLDKCKVVTFTLTNISEAFQFFDSQNARGLDLQPHDLLKAYHLRAFGSNDEEQKKLAVQKWEKCSSKDLAKLFSNYLYPIRRWLNGYTAYSFKKENIDLFKGVNLAQDKRRYPYIRQLEIVYDFFESDQKQNENINFPFQLDQPVINGRYFFKMIGHYFDVEKKYKVETLKSNMINKLDNSATIILNTLKNYEGRGRTGDQYVRNLFECLMVYYIDKFGLADISRAIEKAFIWAYSLRLKRYAVSWDSINKYVLENNMFKRLKEAVEPADFLGYPLPIIKKVEATKMGDIESLFKDRKYLLKTDSN
ncbi:DUF262 domain-containing protein [Neisseria zalophi]|uniref:DUF262 domain-containing protein n=1 Tax=Neisseria zalophi TaxID=640030 RepID=A0A5J6PUJ9_9NEIS|nr:DUF262 domain-containing protein [Neisseria zalophi]QEY26428.1 DUF262 domain-containing protein [Neisseria zalophi]